MTCSWTLQYYNHTQRQEAFELVRDCADIIQLPATTQIVSSGFNRGHLIVTFEGDEEKITELQKWLKLITKLSGTKFRL